MISAPPLSPPPPPAAADDPSPAAAGDAGECAAGAAPVHRHGPTVYHGQRYARYRSRKPLPLGRGRLKQRGEGQRVGAA